ncbi:unnamed protein product [Moneuplotes crassus]|uniref:Uncharacterized protein n=1 Tax=Euplotes crassus TaxID=5936 RepID=A0AAD1Y7X4_EUPCR|nr:unnamed protein product [Moneuplotes crassus]
MRPLKLTILINFKCKYTQLEAKRNACECKHVTCFCACLICRGRKYLFSHISFLY